MLQTICDHCGLTQIMPDAYSQCKDCLGPIDFITRNLFSEHLITHTHQNIWRYQSFLPFDHDFYPLVSFGEGNTALLQLSEDMKNVLLKVEYMSNTSSFLDRGACISTNYWAMNGVNHIRTASLSGDGAAAIAAYCTSLDIKCTAYLGKSISDAKMQQIWQYGATIVDCDNATSENFLKSIEVTTGERLILPATDPFFLVGAKTISFEIWEQNNKKAPDAIFVPVGNGSLLKGLYKGFKELIDGGAIKKLPIFVGVQLERQILTDKDEMSDNKFPQIPPLSIARGLKVEHPIRKVSVDNIIKETGGFIELVSDEDIILAVKKLGLRGFSVTPIGAVGFAGILKAIGQNLFIDSQIVVPLTA